MLRRHRQRGSCCLGKNNNSSRPLVVGPVVVVVAVLLQEHSSCWDGRPFGHNGHGPKSGGGLLFAFPWGSWVLRSNTMSPGPRSTSVPSDILIHPTVGPQYTNGTGHELAVPDSLCYFNMVLSATDRPLETTFDFGKTWNSVGEHRLTSNATLMVERRDIWCKKLQKTAKNDARLASTPKSNV